MLQDVLRLLQSHRVSSVSELARELHVSEALVAVMLDDLERRGYLIRSCAAQGQSCAGCRAARSCHPGASGAVWALTEAGARAACRMGP